MVALVVAAAWADEPFFYFVREWYRTIQVATPYYFDAWKTETREDIARLVWRVTARARSAPRRVLPPRGSATPDVLTV